MKKEKEQNEKAENDGFLNKLECAIKAQLADKGLPSKRKQIAFQLGKNDEFPTKLFQSNPTLKTIEFVLDKFNLELVIKKKEI